MCHVPQPFPARALKLGILMNLRVGCLQHTRYENHVNQEEFSSIYTSAIQNKITLNNVVIFM